MSTGNGGRSSGGTAATVGRALGRWTRGGRWWLPVFFAALSGIALAVIVGAFALHLEVILLFFVVVVVFMCIMGLALNPRAAIAEGRALAWWTRGGPWRLPALLALLGTFDLAVTIIAIRWHAPFYFFVVVIGPVVMFFVGLTTQATWNRQRGDTDGWS